MKNIVRKCFLFHKQLIEVTLNKGNKIYTITLFLLPYYHITFSRYFMVQVYIKRIPFEVSEENLLGTPIFLQVAVVLRHPHLFFVLL